MIDRQIDTEQTRKQAWRIREGALTTKGYRWFCRNKGIMACEGVFNSGAPDAFPYKHAMKCDNCGFIAEQAKIETGDEFGVCTLKGIHTGSMALDEPDEYDTICPECGHIGEFVDVETCDECDEYPCCCELDETE